MKTTKTEALLEAQKTEIQFQSKLKTLDIEQDRLTIYAWMGYAGLAGAVIMLITI